MLTARFRTNPLLPAPPPMVIARAMTIAEIVAATEAPDWFREQGEVRLNGHVILPGLWHVVRVKPEAEGVVELYGVPQGKKTALILGAVALTALTAGIGAGALGPAGIGLFGSSFAAGGLGATLTAAGVGIAGQLALTALAAPTGRAKESKAGDLSQAGISANQVSILEPLPVILGSIMFSPPLLAFPYTTFEKDEITVHAVVGVQGRCSIDNVVINGVDSANIERLTVETREGSDGDTPRTIALLSVVEQDSQVKLSEFRCRLDSGKNDRLTDQDTPDNSAPGYHTFETDGTCDEVWIRLLFPGGIVDTNGPSVACVPFRIEARKVGDVAWRKFPTVHVQDVNKASGPLRAQIKLKWQTQPSGPHYSNASNEWPIFELTNLTGVGETFAYSADDYFRNTGTILTTQVPTMTGPTTSGVTMSASSEFSGTYAAWKAGDSSSTSAWRPTANSLPAWLKWSFSAAKEIRSYTIQTDISTLGLMDVPTSPSEWYWEGSNDDVNWTRLDTVNVKPTVGIPQLIHGQIGSPGSYLHYKLNVVDNLGAASQDIEITAVGLYLHDAVGTAFKADTANSYGDIARHVDSGTEPRCVYGSLDETGATFYLDPDQWEPGAYEIRIKRGVAFGENDFDPLDYKWNGNEANADFFDYRTSSGEYVIRIGQKNYRSECVVEVFSTVSHDEPFDPTGIAFIAVSVPNLRIESISAQFSSYARVWDGSVWLDTPQVTANPAALYRSVLLGWANADPVPGEIIDEDALAAWFDRCDAAGHQCNAIASGLTVAQVLQLVASCGYASPRLANVWSVVEDYDRSGDAITMMITPLNSRDLGSTNPGQRLPHAILAEYADETDNYAVKHVTVYADGYSAATATLIERVTYTGFTNEAKVTARAEFDLKTARLRTARYVRELGWDGYLLKRGDLVGLTDDVLDLNQAYARIASVQTSAGNVVSVTLDAVMPFSTGQGDVLAVSDITSLADILDTDQAMGIAIRLEDGTVLLKQVSEVTDSNICTFSTPFADTGVVVAGLLVAAGVHGRVVRRCVVLSIEPTGIDSMRVTLADEAPEIFA